jgi:hypothetical protein
LLLHNKLDFAAKYAHDISLQTLKDGNWENFTTRKKRGWPQSGAQQRGREKKTENLIFGRSVLLALAFALLLGAFALGGAGRLGRGRRFGSRAARLTFLGVLLRLGQIGQAQVAGPGDLALRGAGRWQRG